jgi:TRAP-type C4-dicarboxylate transport system permease small subunit
VARLIRGLEALSQAAGFVAGAGVLGLSVFIAAAVVSRRVLGVPILAADELSGYFLLAIVFLGLAYTMKAGGHIRAGVVLERVPRKVRAGLEFSATLLAFGFSLVLLLGCWGLVAEYYTRGTLSFRYLQVPLWIPGTLLVLGTALLALQLLARLLTQCSPGADPPSR